MSNDIYLNSMTSEQTTTPSISTKKISFKDGDILGITQDHNVSDNTKIPTAYALNKLFNELSDIIAKIDPNDNAFKDYSVISKELLSPMFDLTKEEWIIYGWDIVEGKIVYKKTNAFKNYVKIPDNKILDIGTHFVTISIDTLTNGNIVFKDKNNTILKTFDIPGTYYFEVEVTDPDTDNFIFEAIDQTTIDPVTIGYIGFSHVTKRIKDYIYYSLDNFMTGGGTSVSIETLQLLS